MKTLVLILLTAVTIVLTGCNTMNGLGQDLENLGVMVQGKNKTDKATEVVQPEVEQVQVVEPEFEREIIYTEEPGLTQ